MSQVSFVRREHLGSGNYEWTYRCTCDGGQSSQIKVTSGNSIEAEMLAQMDCDENCGEARSSSIRGEYLGAIRQIARPGAVSAAFIVTVNEVTDKAYVATLCSGDEIIVPKDIVKSFRVIGRSAIDGQEGSSVKARIELDPEDPSSLTILQLAKALERELGSASAGPEGEKNREVCQQVGVQVSGMACQWSYGYFNSAYPLTGAVLARAEGCSVSNLTRIGQTQVRFTHAGPGGMPCQNNYGGKVYLDVCWIQP